MVEMAPAAKTRLTSHAIGKDITRAVSAFVTVIVARTPAADQPLRVGWSVFRTVVIKVSFPKNDRHRLGHLDRLFVVRKGAGLRRLCLAGGTQRLVLRLV